MKKLELYMIEIVSEQSGRLFTQHLSAQIILEDAKMNWLLTESS